MDITPQLEPISYVYFQGRMTSGQIAHICVAIQQSVGGDSNLAFLWHEQFCRQLLDPDVNHSQKYWSDIIDA